MTHLFLGSGIRERNQRCTRPRQISRELIPRHHSGTTRNPHHDLLPSHHRGRHIFSIPGLQPLALGPDFIPISLDSISLSTCPPNNRQPRTMQIRTNPAKVWPTIFGCGSGEHYTPWEQDRLVDCIPSGWSNAAVAPTIRPF